MLQGLGSSSSISIYNGLAQNGRSAQSTHPEFRPVLPTTWLFKYESRLSQLQYRFLPPHNGSRFKLISLQVFQIWTAARIAQSWPGSCALCSGAALPRAVLYISQPTSLPLSPFSKTSLVHHQFNLCIYYIRHQPTSTMAQSFSLCAGPDTDIWKKPPTTDVFNGTPSRTHHLDEAY